MYVACCGLFLFKANVITFTAVSLRRSRFSLSENSCFPFLLFALLHFLGWFAKIEGLCADVPGERPVPLPWENMWSGSVYPGTLSSCVPHSLLASVSP